MTDTVTNRNGDTYSIIQPKDFTNRQVGQRISIDVDYMRSLFESVSTNESSLIAAVIKQAEVLNMCPASMEEIQAISKVSSSIERQIRRLIEETEPYNNINPMVKYNASQSSRKQFFINQLITAIHAVRYDKNQDGDIGDYALRTNRIMAISNVMANQSKNADQPNEKRIEKKSVSLTALFPAPSKRFWIDSEFRYLESGAKRFLDRILNQIDGHLSTGR